MSIGTKYKVLPLRELRGLIRVLTLGVDKDDFYIIQRNLFSMSFNKLGLNFLKNVVYIFQNNCFFFLRKKTLSKNIQVN